MTTHHAGLRWKRNSDAFTYDTYNRAHEVTFKDGAIVLEGSAAPAYLGDAARVDPEEAFVASLSACHMLSLLAVCARRRLIVDAYEDSAEGLLEKNAEGRLAITRVTLRPRITFAPGVGVDDAALAEIHRLAHEICFIANSVKTDVRIVSDAPQR